MKNEYKLIAVAAFVLVMQATFSGMCADDSAADPGDIYAGDPKVGDKFKDNSNGSLVTTVGNKSNDTDYRVWIVVKEGDRELSKSDAVILKYNSTQDITSSFKLGSGSHNLTVNVWYNTQEGEAQQAGPTLTITVNSEKTLWSGQTPYIVLIIVALIIVVMGFIWFRGRPKSQPAVTFNDLEEGKITESPAVKTTARQKYEGRSQTSDESGPVKYKSSRRK